MKKFVEVSDLELLRSYIELGNENQALDLIDEILKEK